MSKTLNNPKAFARQDEAESPAITAPQITDGADFPHTGLIKTLNQGIIGNYATSGFNATGVTATQATFANGVVFRQGKKIDVTGSLQTIGTTYTNGYHLLVNGTGTTTLTLRSPVGADIVPSYTAGDVIIAVLVHTGNNPMQIQYLTFNKTENSLSIAHDNSSDTYTEAATIQVSSTGVDITSSHAHLTIQNTVADGEIRIKGKKSTGPTIIDAVTFDMDDEVAVFGGAITSVGAVTAAGEVLTKNTITNNGNNRILTATTQLDEHNAEQFATFDGSTLAITGAITGTTLSTTGLITTSANNITAPAGSVSAVSIGAGTNGISNAGKYTQSWQLAADALNPTASIPPFNYLTNDVHGHVIVNEALFPNNRLIDCSKEHYYVGLDTQAQATHNAGAPLPPTGVTGEFQLLTVANETNRAAGNLTAHIYPVDTVFGGNTFFVGIQKPENHIGRTISITNITAYGLYVLVGNENAADPSQAAQRRRMNGGQWNSTHPTGMLSHTGNTRCVNMSRILTGTSQFYDAATSFGGDWDAILVKPRETITLSALDITAENPGTHQQDVFNQQGLHNFPTSGSSGVVGMWFLKSVTSSAGFANVGHLNGAFVHIPVWMTGTSFICVGTNQVMLPSHPPIGTQYSFLVKQGTTSIDRITTVGSEAHMLSSLGSQSGQEEFYELAASASSAPLSISAGNGKTVIYTENRNWEVIG